MPAEPTSNYSPAVPDAAPVPPDSATVPAGASAGTPASDGATPPTTPPQDWYKNDRYSKLAGDDVQLLTKYKTEDDFVKGSIEAMRLVGKKGQFNAEIPDAKDPNFDKKMSEVFKQLGRPETVEGYDITMLEVPEELKGRISFPEDFAKAAASIAHKQGISQEGLNELAALQQKIVIDAEAAMLKASLEKAAEVEKELAKDPNFDTDKEMVRRLYGTEEAKGLAEEMDATGLGNVPVLFKILASYAKSTLGEGTIDAAKGALGGTGSGEKPALSKYEQNKLKFPLEAYMWGPKDAT